MKDCLVIGPFISLKSSLDSFKLPMFLKSLIFAFRLRMRKQTSARAKTPRAMTRKSIPSRRLTFPMVNRLVPVWESIPMVTTMKPRTADVSALRVEPSERLEMAVKPSSMRAKYSGGPKMMATLANTGANSIKRMTLTVPPTKEAMAEIARAFPAFPCWAMG